MAIDGHEIQRMQETRLTARLPRLDVEIIRQEAVDADGEMVCIRLHARPTFETWARVFLQDLAPHAALMPWMQPFLAPVHTPLHAWSTMLATMWLPWLTPLLTGAGGLDEPEVLPPERQDRPGAAADALLRTGPNTHR